MFRCAELDHALDRPGAQRFFELAAEHDGVGGDRPLILDGACAGEDFVVELLGHVAGDDCGIDLTLFERLPALAITAAEQHFLKEGFRVGFLAFAELE